MKTARWRSGNALVCKTSTTGFDSRPGLLVIAHPATLTIPAKPAMLFDPRDGFPHHAQQRREGAYNNMGHTARITPRQKEIKERLDQGMQARDIANDLGITRNAVYQQIQRGRRDGWLPPDYTPTGAPMRELRTPGYDVLARLISDDDADEERAAGTLALAQELRRTRDELGTIYRRLAEIVPN